MHKIFILPLLLLLSCSSNKNNNNTNYQEQKIINTIKNMQFTGYPDMWEEVKKYEKKGLTKSAYEIVKKIYLRAKKEQNSPQIIKSLLYQSKYMMQLEENSQLKIIQNFEKEIAENTPPTSNILENYLAQLYWNYYQNNRWKFSHRTETGAKVDPKDFRTWDLKTLFKEVYVHFDASLQNKAILQNLPVDKWETILEPHKDTRKYRPTLYDLLLHEALKFYQSDENTLTSPAYKFSIDKPEYLSGVQDFIKLNISTKDSLSLQAKALWLYQDLLRFRFHDKNIDALAMADLERLQFVYKHAVFSDKDRIYLETLKNFVQTYQASEVSALAYYYQAEVLYKQGNKYTGKDEKLRWKKKEALKLAEKAVEKYPESYGAKRCKILIEQIKKPSLSVELEKNIPENQPALVQISFQNIDKANLYIYQTDYHQWEKIWENYNGYDRRKAIEKLKLIRQKEISLSHPQDYQPHTTEIILKALPNAQYVIMLKTDRDDQWGAEYFQVTDIGLQNLRETGKNTLTIFNRNNGKPVAGAKIKIYKEGDSGYKLVPVEKYSDQKGSFSITPSQKRYYEDYLYEIRYEGNKKAYFSQSLSRIHPYREPQAFQTAFIFTDRSIYRPGQTLYFKTIVLEKQKNRSVVLPGMALTAEFFDANHQKIKEIPLQTNDYGSASGEFQIPAQTLTGNFSLRITANGRKINNSKNIKVEEYKRPKFEVEFKKPEKAYKVNEKIEITGLAKSFAGTHISDAQVTYRVKRKVQMPRWWYGYRPSGFRSEAQEIAHGKLKTDEKGEFVIEFKAIPDLSVSPDQRPVFHYEVFAEVTDLNGETHTATTTVNVGYHSLLAHLEIPGRLIRGKTDSLRIRTTNLNAVDVPAQGKIKIYKLQAPGRVLRKRPWEAPDIQEISKAEFVQLFPHMPYDDTEADYHFWKKGKEVFATDFDTEKNRQIPVSVTDNWPEGKYLAELTTRDKDGNKITDKTYFEVETPKPVQIPDQKYFTFITDKYNYRPGEYVQIFTGSAAPDTYIRVWIEKNHEIIDEKLIKTNGKYHSIKIPVTEKDRGGFALHYAFYAFNDYITDWEIINVPYPSKELEIETLTFRDKLQPGVKEQWRFKIKGPKGEKVAAEMLASMYDASLDKFTGHTWHFDPIRYAYYYPHTKLELEDVFEKSNFRVNNLGNNTYYGYNNLSFDALKWFGFHLGSERRVYYDAVLMSEAAPVRAKKISANASGVAGATDEVIIRGAKNPNDNQLLYIVDGKPVASGVLNIDTLDTSNIEVKILKGSEATALYGSQAAGGAIIITTNNGGGLAALKTKKLQIKARKNLQETAFFFPELHTDKNGNVSFSFTMPEALTKWKLQLLAHTPDLNYAYKELFVYTQKDLMLFPNAPRFVREGDRLILSTKISNLTDKDLQGIAELELIDAVTQKNITRELLKENKQQAFSLGANANTQVSWTIDVPENLEALQYKVMAKAGNQTDAEQNLMPVLSNRMLVTETMPMWVRSNQSKTFVMDKLLHNNSKTLKNHRLTLEITSNPAWYAVQALPYLMEYPYECSEQTFARYYANTLASHIANQNPKIKRVFDTWKNLNSDALLSNLEKNQELKSLIIEETPWLRDAQSESEQKKRIALLFDLNKMSYEQKVALRKLKQMQLPDGGFTWFKGGRYSSRYITQHIVAGLGHLQHLNVSIDERQTTSMLKNAVHYLDKKIVEDYNKLQEIARKQKDPQKYLDEYHTGEFQIHYLYARSFFPDMKMSDKTRKAADYYLKQAQKYWLKYRLYTQGLLSLVSYRNKNEQIAQDIIRSLDENSINSEELGMYWKNNTAGWYWYEAPIETQALLIEAFDEIDGDVKKLDEMRIWLLKNKQTNAWKTTKQTTEAVYALLLRGTDWLSVENAVSVQIGNIKINPAQMPEIKTEAGTGYFKKSWRGDEIKPEMAQVTITKKDKGIAWGGLYWQYFEDLDKITNAKTPVAITKELFIRRFTDTGEKMDKITLATVIKVGDLVRVRVEIKVDRDMEYVHLKDMRAAGFEPVNVLSGYRWQDGLGYYESTRDASTNFFISRLRKGVYVFEYNLRANNAGSFSNGITTLQCMYAPEFSSHSKGMHVRIE